MFWRNFTTSLRVTIADKSTVFWAIVFPLVLATLFHFAFSNMNAMDEFKAVPVAVVGTTSYQADTSLNESLKGLTDGDSAILTVTKVSSKEDALNRLDAKAVDGIIESDGSVATITVRGDTGFNETIIKTAVEQSVQTTSAITAALQYDPSVASKLSAIGSTSYLHDTTSNSVDRTIIYFYSLIGMACLYAGFFGIYGANRTEANLSQLGARLAVSPVGKLKTLLASFLASYAVALFGQAVLFVYLTKVLGVNFGGATWPTLLVMAIGSITGLAIGTLIAAGTKFNENAKINILTVSIMICSLLAGMMGSTGLKHMIDQDAPLLAAVNPVNSISDALYATYYFGIGERYWSDVLYLSVFTIIALLVAWLITRRKTYASL